MTLKLTPIGQSLNNVWVDTQLAGTSENLLPGIVIHRHALSAA